MQDIQWIKLDTNIFDNRKIRQIECMPDGDAMIVIWLKLLVLAGNINDGGCVYFTKDIPFTDQLLANQFNRPIATIQLALTTFERFGMIEIVDNVILVSNWERYQNIEGMERIRAQTRKRVARHREKQKLLAGNVTVTQGNATEKIREDKNREDKEKDNRTTAKRFTAPTLDEVKAYCDERNNGINPEHFIDYYKARNWELSKGRKVKDWKACIRTWERNGFNKPKKKVGENGVKLKENRDNDLDDIF